MRKNLYSCRNLKRRYYNRTEEHYKKTFTGAAV